MNGEHRSPYEYEEIHVTDYVKVIMKRKILIFVCFVCTMLVAGVLTFAIPKLHYIKPLGVIIEVGMIEGKPVRDPHQILAEIENNLYVISLAEKLDLPLSQFPRIKVTNPTDTNFVKLEIRSGDTERARKILEELAQFIVVEQEEKITIRIASLQDQIKLSEKSIEILQKDKTQIASTLILLSEIRNLKSELDTITHPAIRKIPDISQGSAKSSLAFNVVIGAVLGLFLGILFALGREWWEKNMSEKKAR